MTYVRRAIENDIPELLPICRAFHAESPVHSKLSFDDDTVNRLLSLTFVDPGWLALVAVDDDDGIVGMGLFFCACAFFSMELEVGELTLYVAPKHRGGRAALMILKDAIAWAEMKGASRMGIGVTTGINEDQAARFFGKFGFEKTGLTLQRITPPSA